MDDLAARIVHREERGIWESLGRAADGRWLIVAWVKPRMAGARCARSPPARQHGGGGCGDGEDEAPRSLQHMTDEEFEEDFSRALHRERLRQISIRLPESVIERSKEEARGHDVPYQTLLKALIETGPRCLSALPKLTSGIAARHP
ncbi:MAG TPA: CopG family antitoxin [Candidatus Dormibacteraeota bacterium]|nr:CopG family antitoxin [Candidatus Dormibacteraeota bacterium]